MNERDIFIAALQQEDPEHRRRYLDDACGADAALRRRLEELLQRHEQAGSFLEAAPPSPTFDQPLRETPGSVIGPYKLLQQIGEGGMGSVFMAEQTHPVQRKVALKVIKPGMDSRQVIARFEAERQALAMMDHVNIARVFDGGTTGTVARGQGSVASEERAGSGPATGHWPLATIGRPYFVMELVHGVPITKYCDDNRLTPRERLELFVPVCQAIQHAHQKGIIHRDIKPSNVMVTLYDGKPVPKVIDFGVAKATEQKLTERTLFTQYGTMVGTLEYMSPEQAEMSALGVDTRSDIYSLGVLLYELLTGSTPLTHKRMKEAAYAEILRMIKEEEPPKPSTRLSDSGEALASISANRHTEPAKLTKLVRGELDWIVMKCLEKDRNRRYETASALAADAQRYLDDEPVQACPPSAGYRLRKFVRRKKGPVLAAALILGALLAGIVGTTLGLFQARAERDEKEKAREQADEARADATAKAKAEGEARRARELTLTDMYTSSGLAAGTRDDSRQAVLWFAYAARLAGDDRERADANRTRAAAWGRLAIQPVRAFHHPAEWVENNMVFHPGGRHLLTHGVDSPTYETTCRLWDLEREAALPFPGNPGVVSAAAWDATGKRLAVGTPRGEVTIFAFPSGELPQSVPFAGRISRLLFSPDRRYLAVAAAKRVRVWDCRQAAFATPELEHPAPIDTLAFHPQGELLATGCQDWTCRVFAVLAEKNAPLFTVPHTWYELRFTGQTPIPPLFLDEGRALLTLSQGEASWRDPRTGEVLRVLPFGEPGMTKGFKGFNTSALNGDGKHVVLASLLSDKPHVRICDVASAQPVSPNLGHRAMQIVCSAAFSPDGQTLLTGSSDHTARLWSVPEGKPLGGPLTHPTTVSAVAFAGDGRHLATAQGGGLIRLWALPAGNPRDYRVPVGAPSYFRLSRDGHLLLPMGQLQRNVQRRSTQVFDITTGERVGAPLQANGIILDAAFSPDGLQVAFAVSGAASPQERIDQPGEQPVQLLLWDWRAGKLQHKPLQLPPEPRSLAYRPDGRQLAVIGAKGELVVIDPLAGKELWRRPAYPAHLFNPDMGYAAIRFSPDNRSVLTFRTPTNSAHVWDALTGEPGHELKHNWRCHNVQFSPDGRFVATASFDKRVCVWDLATGEQLADLPHPDWTFTAHFSPDGQHLLTACRDGMARLWDWRARREVRAFEHEHEVKAVAFTPDSRHVLSASDDGVLKIWEWRTGKLVCPPFALGGAGLSLAVTPDGKRVAVGGFMKDVRVFHLEDWLAPSTLEPDDLCLWGEIVSGQRIEGGGGVTNLTAEEWLQRWQVFRQRQPGKGAGP